MTTRQQLLQRWESGLETNAGPVDENSRFDWMRRVYVRIYRFLISRYASGEWRADSTDGASEDEVQFAASPMPFVDNTAEVTGLEPKSQEQIRGKLTAIRDANEARQVPGGRQRLSIKSWVPIAAGKDRKTVRRIHLKLAACGFSVRTECRTTDYCVEVRYGDFEDALRVLRHGDPRTSSAWHNSDRARLRSIEWSDGSARFFQILGLVVFGFASSVFLAMFFSGSLADASLANVLVLFLLAATGFLATFMPYYRR